MNSRERVVMALNHQEPDKVPLDLGSTVVTTIAADAYHNLRAYRGLPPDTHPLNLDLMGGLLDPREDLLELYEIDFRTINIKGSSTFELTIAPDDTFYDEFGVRYRKASYYYDAIERPLAKFTTSQEIEQIPWPDPYDPARVKGLREEARQLLDNTPYALVADIPCLGPFEGGCILRGHDRFCMDLASDPQIAETILDKVTDFAIGIWDAYLGAVGDYVQVVAQGDDIGMQTNLYLSPRMYRKYIKPRHRRIYDFIHSKTKAKVFMHSCGSVYDVIPDLIEVGVDVLNPVQPGAAKMDLARLKQEFGKEICFWGGGIDVQQVMPYASLVTIETEVKHAMEIMAPGGGYIFAPSHNIQADVSPDRIHKTYDTALRFRTYAH